MKALPWILAGAGVGAALMYIYLNQPLPPQAATGWDSVENAAKDAVDWGSKARVSGAGSKVVGKLKEGLGRVAGDPDLADEGVVDQVAGAARNAVGKVAQAAGDTLHQFNR